MKDAKLRRLATWGARRNREPFLGVGQVHRSCHVEFGRTIQTGSRKLIPVFAPDYEFSGVGSIEFLARSIYDLDRWFSAQFSDIDDERRTRFGTGHGEAAVRKPAPDDVACLRQRKVPRHGQNRRFFLLLEKPFCGTALSIAAYCSSVRGPLSASYRGSV